MVKDTKNEQRAEAATTVVHGGLETAIRQRARVLIDAIVEEELEATLGAAPSARVGVVRQGYRHGSRDRTLTTSLGPTTFAMPRARVMAPEGGTVEWRSKLVPRYQRRSEQVDAAILGVYLSGTNTRRIKGALAPLLRGGPLSKDAVSRLVGRIADDFETWRSRDLANDHIQYLQLDGWYPKVRIGKRRVRVPVLVTRGVRADGERVVVDARLVGDESTAAWRDVIHALVARHVGIPRLAVIDGNPGLAAALREQWPRLAIQRCTTHKLRNVEAKVGARLQEELAEDYRRMISSPSCAFQTYSGKHCERRTRWSASTGNSGVERKPKRVSPTRDSSAAALRGCFVAGRSNCDKLMAGTKWRGRLTRRRSSLNYE